jgi:hypothetical protein
MRFPSIRSKILCFYQQLQSDTNHRYRSWEHCYKYFSQREIDKDVACLHLSFYLASWGMYRGSSFLLWKNYLVHREVVKHLLPLRHLRCIDLSNECEARIDEICELTAWIKKWYQDNVSQVNGKTKKINVTDTLVTKILLGTLGCMPAFDTYFKDGVRAVGMRHSKLSKKNYLSLVEFYRKNRREFEAVQQAIRQKSGTKYPAMKLIDMYFWQIGFDRRVR